MENPAYENICQADTNNPSRHYESVTEQKLQIVSEGDRRLDLSTNQSINFGENGSEQIELSNQNGIENLGGESNDYDEIPLELQVNANGNRKRKKDCPIYGLSPYHITEDVSNQEKPYKQSKELKIGFVHALFIILLIALATLTSLILNVLIILGIIGPTCSCDNQGAVNTIVFSQPVVERWEFLRVKEYALGALR